MALPNLPTAENELGSVLAGVDDVKATHENDNRRMLEALALTVPRRFGDATDHFTIDPDNARITAAGAARPTRRLWSSLVGYEDMVHVTGHDLARVRYNDGAEYTADWVVPVPAWVDLSVYAPLHIPAEPCLQNTVLRYKLILSIIRPTLAIPSSVYNSGVASWTFDTVYGATTTEVVDIRFGTFGLAALGVQADDQLHINLTRYADDAADTINLAWWVVASPFFEVKAKELS